MGAVSDALRSSAEEFGAEARTNTPVERILQMDGRVTGVVLAGGEELEADIVVAATHPRIVPRTTRKEELRGICRQHRAVELPQRGSQDQPRPLGAS